MLRERAEPVNDQPDVKEAGPEPKKDGEQAAASTAVPTFNVQALVLTLVVFVASLALGVWILQSSNGVTYTAAEGLGAFALFYVVAQAAERLIELVLPLLHVWEHLDKPTAQLKRDTAVMNAVKAPSDDDATAQEAADAQGVLDQVTVNRTTVAFGLAAGVGMLLCSYLHANFLTALGVSAPDKWWSNLVAVLITGLAVGGGSKQLHDLITNVSKASDKKTKPVETGGDA